MTDPFSIEPQEVPRRKTDYRCIKSQLPVPESVPILEKLYENEPRSMQGQPPLVWDRANGFSIFDPYGNKWLDFSSGVLVTNVGHSPKAIREAVVEKASEGHLFSYYFPTQVRAELVETLAELAPAGLDKVYLLTTGAETTEAAMKLAKTHAHRQFGPEKRWIVHFERAFHGRTMGAQLAGGDSDAKSWIGPHDGFVQVPFPDGFRTKDRRFSTFTQALRDQDRTPEEIAAVIVEAYQGGGASFAPANYVQQLREWCSENDVLLIFDEVQSGFGRTGRLFGFEHYDIVPDLICCGKGISGSMPLSAVLGPTEILDQYGPGAMSSTQGGHPVSCAAAIKNLELLDQGLLQNVRRNGESLQTWLHDFQERYTNRIGAVHGRGYVWGIHVIHEDSEEPDGDLAARVVEECFYRGLLMFAPVGPGHGTIKLAPPLVTPENALREGVEVIEASFEALLEDEIS